MIGLFIVLTLALFAPAIYYNEVFLVNFVIVGLVATFNKKKEPVQQKLILILMLGVISFSLKLFFYQSLEDVKWFLRFVQFIAVIIFFKTIEFDKKYQSLLWLLGIYTGVTLVVAAMEYLRMHDTIYLKLIQRYYWSEGHAEVRYRVKGLNAGPGQLSVRLFLINMVFGYRIVAKRSNLVDFIIFLTTIVIMLMSGSRTGLGAVLLVSAVVMYFGRYKLVSGLVLLLVPAFQLLQYFSLERVYRLLEQGASDTSSLGRIEKWTILLDKALSTPGMIFLGWSETEFEKWGNITDSELITVFLYFGLFGIAMFLVFQFTMLKSFVRHSWNFRLKLFFIASFIGMGLFQMFSYCYTDYITLIFILFLLGYLKYHSKEELEKEPQNV